MGSEVLGKISHVECTVIRRENRFVVLVETKSGIRRAYITNTGRLEEYIVRGKRGFCRKNNNPGKTTHRLFAIEDKGAAALIDTHYQMLFFEKAVSKGLVKILRDCILIKRNPRLGNSVLDFLYRCRAGEVFVETKSAVLRGDDKYAMYPDCPTERGRRHILEITGYVERGGKALIVFIAALPSVTVFKPYEKGDPMLATALRKAVAKGVPVAAFSMHYDPREELVLWDGEIRVEV